MWRVLSLVAPSLGLNATVGVDTLRPTYPWSVKPDSPVSVEQLRAINRDHYEGTPFDLTKGMASGPFGSPNRLDGGTRFFPQPKGAWERPIAMYRTSYSLVIAPAFEKGTGVLWYAPHNPHASVYVPFFQSAAGHPDAVPASYSSGTQDAFSFLTVAETKTAWWAALHVMNWMDRMYSFMAGDVQEAQQKLESDSDSLVRNAPTILAALVAKNDDDAVRSLLADLSADRATTVATAWWELAGNLTKRFNDGYINSPDVGQIVGYPSWWLERVGYTKFPEPPPAEQCT